MNDLRLRLINGLVTTVLLSSVASTVAAPNDADADNSTTVQGPVRLSAQSRVGQQDEAIRALSGEEDTRLRLSNEELRGRSAATPKTASLSEFEAYASQLASTPIQRLGSDLMLSPRGTIANVEANRQVPADYVVGLGDEIQLTIWGSVDADLQLTVDRAGRILIPRVGPVVVAGVRHADLSDLLSRRIGQVFKNFQLSASLGRLRSIRYYVTGFVVKPGAYSVSSLATVMTGLVQSGGPSAAGSFRNIELRRNGEVIGRFDLYDLLIRGDKKGDLPLQADDVLHVGPTGPQVAVIGSVNKPAIVELKPDDTVNDAIAYVGGLSTVAETGRMLIERLSDRNDSRVKELKLPSDGTQKVVNGDVLRAFNSVATTLPQAKQYKNVRIEGEVARPGDYVLPPNSTLMDAVKAAGGLTAQAFVYGTDFSRESVRKVQETQYERALRDLETGFARNTATRRVASADEAQALAQTQSSTGRLIERLRAIRPTGRIVLDLTSTSQELPLLHIEDADRIYIPPAPTTVGVFGSVYNGGSYLLRPGSSIEDVLQLAGGPTRGADTDSIFVIRANGDVVSAGRLRTGWVNYGSRLGTLAAVPGDTIFVPEEMNKTTFMQEAKDWTQILYQFGLGAAALKTIKN